jgi:hypothetical protein
MSSTGAPGIARLTTFAEQAVVILRADERIRALWLTGSLAAGTADPQSDVDLRAVVPAESFATIEQWWPDLIDLVAPTVWKRRWPSPPNEAILGAITADYLRFDLVIQSVTDTQPRRLEAARVLFDKDGIAERFPLTAAAPPDPYAHLPYIVEEFIRLLGMLPIVVERDDVPMGMEGQMGVHSLLISLLLLENGIDRTITGKRHVAAFLSAEQRVVLAGVSSLDPSMESLIQGRLAYARVFLPRARRLMEARSLPYPDAFETATKQHLRDTLGVTV